MSGPVRAAATVRNRRPRGALLLVYGLVALVLGLATAPVSSAESIAAPAGAHPGRGLRAPIAIAPDADAYDVNERGVVVGYRYVDQVQRAFRWRNGRLVDLGQGIAHAVNNAGTVVGTSNGQAVRWRPDATVEQLAPGSRYSEATDIDSDGTIVGNIAFADGVHRAFVLPSGASEVEVLPVPAGHEDDSVSAVALNDRGTIVGELQVTSGDVSSLALVWQGHNHRVSILPGTGYSAYVGDINERDVIVGATTVGGPTGGYLRALRWTNPAHPPQEVGIPGTDSIARGVNERGLVVGVQYGVGTAFQWDPRTGRTTELTGFDNGYSDAWAVNNRGVAVGNSTLAGTGTATVFGRP